MPINEMIEILNAYKEGNKIECRFKDRTMRDSWSCIQKPDWNWALYEYRIKPENNEKYEVGKKYLCTFKPDWEKL